MSETFSAARRLFAGAAIGAALLALPVSANAASYVFTLSGNVGDGTYGSFDAGPTYYNTYELLLPGSLTLTSGDDVTLNLSLDGPLTVPAGNQFFGFNLKTDTNTDSLNVHDSGLITFTGGDANAPVGPQGANFSGGLSNVIFTSGPAYSFTGLISSSIFTFDGDPLLITGLSISYQVDSPGATPLPAALPLFAGGIGVMGLLARRRKRKAAAV